MSETEKKPARAAKADPKPDDAHLIAVHKDGQTLHVHPAALAEHKKLGWREA